MELFALAEEFTYCIPPEIPVLGLTAGLPVTLSGLTGPSGRSVGMESYGYSAPYQVLDQQLGYTAEHVYNHALDLLESFENS